MICYMFSMTARQSSLFLQSDTRIPTYLMPLNDHYDGYYYYQECVYGHLKLKIEAQKNKTKLLN